MYSTFYERVVQCFLGKERHDMKYICGVCGYIYDETVNDTPFNELPDSWVCPLCGAPKSVFEPLENEDSKEIVAEVIAAGKSEEKAEESPKYEVDEDIIPLSAGELSALFSNLARGCEKQYQEEARQCFSEIAGYFEDQVPEESEVDMERIAALLKEDLDKNYADLKSKAKANGDRGTLRITTWGEKVTIMAKSLVERYLREGDAFLNNTGLYICTVCGFLYVGDSAPELCPVCKVPSWKFEKIEGRTK